MTENYEDLDRHLDELVADMRKHLDGADPMNSLTTEVFAGMFQQAAEGMPDLGVPMLSLTLARAVQRLTARSP